MGTAGRCVSVSVHNVDDVLIPLSASSRFLCVSVSVLLKYSFQLGIEAGKNALLCIH